MDICKNLNTIAHFDKSVLTIGSFDGMHSGHMEIIKEIKLTAKSNNIPSVIVTFDPHPKLVLDIINKEKCKDSNCPNHGSITLRGRTFKGNVVSTKAHKSAVVEWGRLKFVPKYERYTKSIDEVELGQYKFFIGGAIFSLFYLIQVSLFFYFTNNVLYAFIYFLLLIPTGNFALNYHNNIMSYLKHYRLFRIFSKRSDIIEDLEKKRKEIIDFIIIAKEAYKRMDKSG